MATEVSTFFGNDLEGIYLETGSKGEFEVWANGELVFSKKATGRFPEWRELRDLLQAKMPAKAGA